MYFVSLKCVNDNSWKERLRNCTDAYWHDHVAQCDVIEFDSVRDCADSLNDGPLFKFKCVVPYYEDCCVIGSRDTSKPVNVTAMWLTGTCVCGDAILVKMNDTGDRLTGWEDDLLCLALACATGASCHRWFFGLDED